jgi:DNA-binding transcriptional LysR family regulator
MPHPSELPPLNALRAFEATARLESVSQAAHELFVTHGAVSRQLRILEDYLGQPVFERRGRGLVLTGNGRELRDAVATAFDTLRATSRRLQRTARSEALVLGCPGSVLARWMIPRLETLRRDLPQMNLHLSANEQPPNEALSGLDAALVAATPPWPGQWQVHELASERIGPVMSPQYAQERDMLEHDPRVLLDEAVLHTASRPQAWPAWCRAHGLPAGALPMGQSFEHLYYLTEAAVAGLGVAIAPQQLVADDIAAGRLVAPWGFSETGGIWVLCAPRGSSDPNIPALAHWLRAQLNADST